jgi:hypothetical protein
MTEREALEKRTEYQYSTVMDYGGRFNSDLHGLGKYDYAAIKAGYGDMVEIFADTSKMDAYIKNTADFYNYPQDTWAFIKDTDFWRYAGVTSSPFGILHHYIGVEQNKNRLTVPWEQVEFEHQMVQNYVRAELDFTYVEVPYRACYDEYRGNLGCYYFDTGVDLGEMIYHSMASLTNYYIFDAFKRERFGFGRYGSASSYFGRILDRYMTQLGHGGQYYALYYHIFKDYSWFVNWKDAPYDGNVMRTSSLVAFQYLSDLLSSPAPGSYAFDADTATYKNISLNVGEANSQLDIPVGAGKFPYTQFMNTGGYYDFEHAIWIGSFWEKMASLSTLTNSTAYFSSDFVAELGHRGATSIGFNTLYQIELTDVLGGIVADEFNKFSGVVENGEFRTRPVIGPESSSQDGIPALANFDSVAPSISDWTMKRYAAWYGLSYLPAGFDPTFTDAMAIHLEGNGSQFDTNSNVIKVSYDDPFSGKTFVAYTNNYTYNDREPFAVGVHMIEKANTLHSAWELATGEEKSLIEAKLKEHTAFLTQMRSLNEVYGTMVY